MSNVNVMFFPSTDANSKFVGGGFISSGVLKTRFSVMLKDNAWGFWVVLPSRKGANDQWYNDVETTSKEASDVMYEAVKEKLVEAGLLGGSNSGRSAPSKPARSEAAPAAPRNVTRNTGNTNSGVPGGVPW